jgi:hypothetical protein
MLVKLFVEEVLGAYETAVLADFSETMDFAGGVRKIWLNSFRYFKHNRPYYVLMQYGTSSPLLNKAYQDMHIKQGQYFAPVHRFLKRHIKAGTIHNLHVDVQRALLFSPLFTLVGEYFDYAQRPKQIITEKTIIACCEIAIKGMLV